MEQVTLIHPVSGAEFPFEEEHANRILAAKTGWKKKRGKGKNTRGVDNPANTTTTKGTNAKSSEDCGCGKS